MIITGNMQSMKLANICLTLLIFGCYWTQVTESQMASGSGTLCDVSFPFLEDDDTIVFIKNTRIVIFLSGCPEISPKVRTVYPHAKIFSKCRSSTVPSQQQVTHKLADDSLLQEVGQYMKDTSSNALVVVDDPDLVTLAVLAPFQSLAVSYNFVQLYLDPQGKETDFFPFFYGWFINYNKSLNSLRQQGNSLLDELSGNNQFLKLFSEFATSSPKTPSGKFDIKDYYITSTLIPVGEVLLHCTSFFSDHGKVTGTKQYNSFIYPYIGKALQLEIIGFLVTPRAFGMRVKLSNGDLKLWNMNDSAQMENKYSNWRPSKFSPTNGPGSGAHLTLAITQNSSAQDTGYDLDQIVREEVKDQETGEGDKRLTIPLSIGDARHYGQGLWAIYLNEWENSWSLFSNYY